MSVICCSLLQ